MTLAGEPLNTSLPEYSLSDNIKILIDWLRIDIKSSTFTWQLYDLALLSLWEHSAGRHQLIHLILQDCHDYCEPFDTNGSGAKTFFKPGCETVRMNILLSEIKQNWTHVPMEEWFTICQSYLCCRKSGNLSPVIKQIIDACESKILPAKTAG